MKLETIRLAIPGLILMAMTAVTPVMAQSLDEEPLNILEGNTKLDTDKADDGDQSRLIPLFIPDNKKSEIDEQEQKQDLKSRAEALLTREAVTLRALEKITGESTDIQVKVGEQAIFGGLRVTVRACHQTPPTDPPESIAYLEIEDYGFKLKENELKSASVNKEKRVFHGWMYATSPGLHALEHSIYDVWVIRCMAAAPDLSDSGKES